MLGDRNVKFILNLSNNIRKKELHSILLMMIDKGFSKFGIILKDIERNIN